MQSVQAFSYLNITDIVISDYPPDFKLFMLVQINLPWNS